MTDPAALLPPHNLEAEQSVLGAILLADTVLPALTLDERLRPEHFYREQHATIYAAMLALYDKQHAIDVLTVSDYLAVSGELEGVGGRAMVDAVAGAAPAAGNVREYARIVTELATWRARQLAAHEVLRSVYDRSEEGFAQAEALMARADRPETTTRTAAQLADEAFRYLTEVDERVAWPLPWAGLTDALAGGFRPGDTTLVAGWTNMGKSVVIGGVLELCAEMGATTTLYTNEETAEDWTLRTVASMSGVSFQRLLAHHQNPLDSASAARVMAALQRLHDMPLSVVVISGWPVQDIDRHLRRNRPDVAAVDIVNRIPHRDTAEMDHVSRTLNSAARVAGTHLLIACHLNQGRNVTATPPPPTLRDIRETGSLANDANNVLFVHRDFYELTVAGGGSTGRFEPGPDGRIYLAKVRNGTYGGADVTLNTTRMRFEEV